jgi:hypothetical protein
MAKVRWSGASQAPPVWMGDFGGRDHLMAFPIKLDVAQFRKPDSVVVTVGAAGALAAATSVPVDALEGPIPDNTLLDFGTNKFARLSAAAAAGATSLTVDALATALVDNDTATYAGKSSTVLSVPSGMAIGRTIAERDANALWGPAVNTDDEIFLLAFEIPNLEENAEAVAYRHGGQVKENYLPKWGNTLYWPTALVTVLRGLYEFYLGKD